MSNSTSHPEANSKVIVLERVKTPLAFFTLVVLVCEAILGYVASSCQGSERVYFIFGMLGVLVLLIVVVGLIAYFRPEALSGRVRSGSLSTTNSAAKSKRPSNNVEHGDNSAAELPTGQVPPETRLVLADVTRRNAGPPTFSYSDADNFGPRFDELLEESQRVIMIGTGISILHHDKRRKRFNERIQAGCQVEIYAANPFSPHVEARLIEEETGSPRPLIAKPGLKNWLRDLVAQQANLVSPDRLTVNLFPYYPTFATLIFEHGSKKHYFFYPYGYAQLGTLSPVLCFSSEDPAHRDATKFLEDQYERVRRSSTPAHLIFDLQAGKANPDQLTAFAVYLVPQQDTQVYRFGAEVLGYDVRQRRQQATRWLEDVGVAADFGLHVTVADALYCSRKEDIDLIREEVAFVARGLQPFRLDVTLEKGVPNASSIALACEDPTGSLEVLHHEMVARVYRLAVASNYSLNLAKLDRDNNHERAKLMIQRYHAPYILQRYRPHVSLASSVAEERRDRVFDQIQELYRQRVDKPSVEVGSIAIMERPGNAGRWQIRAEHTLGVP
jgi:hypothetical protein